MSRGWRSSLDAANNDWELVQVVREFMKARTVSKYWAVGRAVDMWDGPIFFRQNERGYWNHNYFMAESDEVVGSQLWFIPWDVDDTFPREGRTSYGQLPRAYPEWDVPVESCAAGYNHFGQSMAPSCFRLIRAFARGLRSEYMEEAAALLDGPFSLCRLTAKIDRWHAAIAPYMAADTAAQLYPAKGNQHFNHSGAKPGFSGKNTRPYEKDDPPMAYAYPPTRIP